MYRSIFALVMLLATCALLAAPAPKSIWDHPIDPDHDCKFVIKDGTAILELPGTDHDLAPKRKRFNAPRLLRSVAGDFVMQVRVSSSFRPSAKSTVDKEDPSVAAGLVLIPADENCMRLEYGAYRRKGEQRTCPALRMRGERIFNMEMDWVAPWKPDPAGEKEAHVYLRLERQGDIISEAISPDGKKWTYSFTVRIKGLPEKVEVGMAAYSTSTEPFKVRFDQFKLTRGERKGRKPGVVFDTKFAR
jgi:hypothetical protein